jgi:hypothetical protein
MLFRKLVAEVQPHGIHELAIEHAVEPREVDVLERAGGGALLKILGGLVALQTFRIDIDDFAGLDLADERRAKVIEGAAFRRGDPAAVDAAEAERAVAHGVARDHQRIGRDDGE